jgi:hypothetical protein
MWGFFAALRMTSWVDNGGKTGDGGAANSVRTGDGRTGNGLELATARNKQRHNTGILHYVQDDDGDFRVRA